MSHWNHRLVKENYSDGTFSFSIKEVFYNEDGSIFNYRTEPVRLIAESEEDLREYVNWCLEALNKPILIQSDIVVSDTDDDYEDYIGEEDIL